MNQNVFALPPKTHFVLYTGILIIALYSGGPPAASRRRPELSEAREGASSLSLLSSTCVLMANRELQGRLQLAEQQVRLTASVTATMSAGISSAVVPRSRTRT